MEEFKNSIGIISDEYIKRMGWGGPFKVCSKCKIEKELDRFSPQKRRGPNAIMSKCKECDNKEHKEARIKRNLLKDPKSIGPYGKFNNPSYNTNRGRLKRYGVDYKEFDRLYKSQNGCCAICDIHQSELKRSLSVDHCHKTGIVRGLLCDECNFGLGKFKDNKVLLTKAIKYLK